jgi:hypothetical protein
VELMAAAGLVDAAPAVHGAETYAVINRVTDAGFSFLRAFQNARLPVADYEALALAEH